MKWDENCNGARLVAEDGEVLERVRWKHGTSEYQVESTGKCYVGIEAAKKAVERSRTYGVAPSDGGQHG